MPLYLEMTHHRNSGSWCLQYRKWANESPQGKRKCTPSIVSREKTIYISKRNIHAQLSYDHTGSFFQLVDKLPLLLTYHAGWCILWAACLSCLAGGCAQPTCLIVSSEEWTNQHDKQVQQARSVHQAASQVSIAAQNDASTRMISKNRSTEFVSTQKGT